MMPLKNAFQLFLMMSLTLMSSAQAPNYTLKNFLSTENPTVFKTKIPKKNGFSKIYKVILVDFFDVDENQTTYIKGIQPTLVCIEGMIKNHVRQGLFKAYVIDSLDNKRRFKVWECEYKDGKKHGQYRVFGLHGGLVSYLTYEKDSLNGPGKCYWIDGKTVIEDVIYFQGSKYRLVKIYSTKGIIQEVSNFVDGQLHGMLPTYYPDGILKEELLFANGLLHGRRRYFHPTGQVWLEQTWKDNLPWNVIANYTITGQKRDAGTLQNGNGTIILYNEDDTIREIETYENGILLDKL